MVWLQVQRALVAPVGDTDPIVLAPVHEQVVVLHVLPEVQIEDARVLVLADDLDVQLLARLLQASQLLRATAVELDGRMSVHVYSHFCNQTRGLPPVAPLAALPTVAAVQLGRDLSPDIPQEVPEGIPAVILGDLPASEGVAFLKPRPGVLGEQVQDLLLLRGVRGSHRHRDGVLHEWSSFKGLTA